MNADRIELSPNLIKLWRLSGARLLANTPTSHVFRAKRDGETVIVKALKPYGEDELAGIDYLRWRNGAGAVKVYDLQGTVCLMEDAGSKTLLDLHDEAGDDAANTVLATNLPALFYPASNNHLAALPDLRSYFAALFDKASRPEPQDPKQALQLAASIAETLLGSQGNVQPLHGDLHHSNLITRDGKTWLAIDPKGVIGDPHYDVANLFGNPRGKSEIVLDPRRASKLADTLSNALGLQRDRILKFALVHAGLSAAWSLEDGSALDSLAQERLDLIPILQAVITG